MSVEITFSEVTEEDIQFVADNMRQADKDEVLASNNYTPRECLDESIKISYFAYTVNFNAAPVMIFGLVKRSALSDTGIPWALGTDGVFTGKREFLKRSVVLRDMMLEECDILTNYVHCDNKQSIRWLKWLGFKFDNPAPYGVNNELFMRFHLGE